MKGLCEWVNSGINSNFMQPECATDFRVKVKIRFFSFALLSDGSHKSSG